MLAFVDLEERVPADHPLTHQSATDPEARLFRKGKGKEARLVFMAHALTESRSGLLVDFLVSEATGTAERGAVPVLLDETRERGAHPQIPGGDKGYDTRGRPARGATHERALPPLSMDARPGIAAMRSVSV